MLDIYGNEIGDEGAQVLATALEINRVSLRFLLINHIVSSIIHHRLSQCWTLDTTELVIKVDHVWIRHCKNNISRVLSEHFMVHTIGEN